MKILLNAQRIALGLLFISIFVCLRSSSAQMVIPKGWENEDSIRFEVENGYPPMESSTRLKTLMDSLSVNMIYGYGGTSSSEPPYGAKRKGYDSWAHDGIGDHIDFTHFKYVKQRIYYPSPERFGFWDDGGYRWRYIDTIHYSWNNNTYDVNDISPYAEFDKDSDFVKEKYFSRMYNSAGDSLKVGSEGRLILGYSDQRDGSRMLRIDSLSPFCVGDKAKTFSARLEFSIDTANIYSADGSYDTDTLPLLRIQILYKRGNDSTNSSKNVLPFVPFKKTAYGTEAGWFKLKDTIITPLNYRSLRYSWRIPDTLESGAVSHQDAWKFKQLNLLLKDLPSYMATVAVKDYGEGEYGGGTDLARIKISAHPDSLVAIDSGDGHYVDVVNSQPPRDVPLIEIRILSTYRSKLRIRSLTWQDTTVDKFLYRARFTGVGKDSTHSLNPLTGAYGGLDDSVHKHMQWFADAVFASGCTIRELGFNDVNPYMPANAMSSVAYVDYMAAKTGLHTQMRPQEGGEKTLQMRRERLGYDGQPPSIVQNQASVTYSQWSQTYGFQQPNVQDVFPGDYIPTSKLGTGAWLTSALDTMQGMLIARIGDVSDPTKAYRAQMEKAALANFSLRGTAYAALKHRKGRQTAWQPSPALWGVIYTGAIKDSNFAWRFPKDTVWDDHGGIIRASTFAASWYNFRPPTPEENNTYFWLGLANGCGGFQDAQGFDAGGGVGGTNVTMFGIAMRHVDSDVAYLDYSYNNGHRRTSWGYPDWWSANHNVVDTTLPEYYLGYSNQYRATVRIMSRLNQIYDTIGGNLFPFKRMTWLDAYSTHRALPLSLAHADQDSATYSGAFLKCSKTDPVRRWAKGTNKEYLDSTATDSLHRTYVEVGLFKDSISPSVVNYAALIVNTRTYPDHKTGDDSAFYCKGLANKDKPHSIFGDIDVRKVYLKIDTTKFPKAFRNSYYVLRDTWHPDTMWLVKPDSLFAIYIKPGDARLIYIEKGISIQAAANAASSGDEFAFNNGRRVAERMGGTRTVVTYTRGKKLYVSNPSMGWTVPGYAQNSAADNISTGVETLIDADTLCHRPSICVGRNDMAVALVYWKYPGFLNAAIQEHPDSPWYKGQNIVYNCPDTSLDFSFATPVCTPIDDSNWLLAAAFTGDPATPSGIIGARFRLERSPSTHLTWVGDPFTYLYQGALADSNQFRSVFPTVASRPLADSMFPIRMAWQRAGMIYYRRIEWSYDTNLTAPTLEADKIISRGLPSYCDNYHPSIGMATIQHPFTTVGFSATNIFDYVTWEAVLADSPKVTSHGLLFPILRTYTQPINKAVGKWARTFQVFKPDTTSDFARYPVVSVNNRRITTAEVMPVPIGKVLQPSGVKDYLRLVWQNQESHRLDLATYTGGWARGGIKERGLAPSLGQTTDSISNGLVGQTVPRSITWIGEQASGTSKQVRITNGWAHWIDTVVKMSSKLRFNVDSSKNRPCFYAPAMKGDVDPPTIKRGGTTTEIVWSQVDVSNGSILTDDWSATLGIPSPVEIYSDSFSVVAEDSILIPRNYIVDSLAVIRNSLAALNDTLSVNFVLRLFSDSSYLQTIESAYITKDAVVFPGTGLNANHTTYKYPTGATTQTAFITLELRRAQKDSLENFIYEYEGSDSLLLSSYKKSEEQRQTKQTADPLAVHIVPNPLSYLATVTVSLPKEAYTTVELFNLIGTKLQTLYANTASGELQLTLDGQNLSNGTYLLRIQSGNDVVTRKVELVK